MGKLLCGLCENEWDGRSLSADGSYYRCTACAAANRNNAGSIRVSDMEDDGTDSEQTEGDRMSLIEISERALDNMELVNKHLQELRLLAARLRVLRNEATDAAAAPGQEDAKRHMVALYAEMADAVVAACDLCDRGPMDVTKLRDELYATLTNPAALENILPSPGMGPGWYTVGQVRQIMRERANNISQMLAGRVLKEATK